MSESMASQACSAQAIKEQAAAWLERSTDDNWTAEDQAAFETWLSTSTAHKLAYWRLDAGWQRSERLAALRPQMRATSVRPRQTMWPLLKVSGGAAAGVFLVIAGAIYASAPSSETFSTPVGGHRILTLADGSRIELNTNTKLHLELGDSTRKVILDRGEAYFQIKHDANNPFVVVAGRERIVDLGTKFLVNREQGLLRVALLEGKAQLQTKKSGSAALVLRPGDVAVATLNTLSVSRKPDSVLNTEISWRRGLLVFENTSLAEVAHEFNRYNASQLVVADKATARIGIGGTFRANNVAAFAEVAQNILGLHVETRGSTIVISSSGGTIH